MRPFSESVVSDCLIAHKKGAPLDATQYIGYLVLDIADSPELSISTDNPRLLETR